MEHHAVTERILDTNSLTLNGVWDILSDKASCKIMGSDPHFYFRIPPLHSYFAVLHLTMQYKKSYLLISSQKSLLGSC